jgi:O-antigen/teichoic acid export membrane protein
VPLAVFSTEFITVIYQSRYADGGLALTVLALGFALKNVLSIHSPILESIGRSKTLSANSAVAAVTNLVLNLLLIPSLGIVGAAIATVVSFVVRDGLAAVQVYRALDWTPLVWRALRPLVIAGPFLAGVAVFVAPRTPTTILWLVAVTGVTTLGYVVAVLVAFGLSETDVMIIRSAQEQYGLDFAAVDWLVRRLGER